MPKKTALILNDTSAAYHWGCYGTSTELRETLTEKGYTVMPVSVVQIHGLKTAPRTEEQFFDPGFRRAFLADNPDIDTALSVADVVIVNGEGTLHGLGQPVFNLLYVSQLAKSVFEKPVHAINMSLFPDDNDSPNNQVGEFYARMLKPLDSVVVREPRSLDNANRLELDAMQGFDCLPRYLARSGYQYVSESDGPIVLGGGLGVDPESFANVVGLIAETAGTRPLHYVTGAKDHPALDDARVIDALVAAIPSVTHVVAETFENWARAIGTASCLVSGRFHHTIAAAFLGTPVVAFRAGTPKLDGLCQALDFPVPLDVSLSESTGRAIQDVQEALAGTAPRLADDVRSRLMADAARNFEMI